MTLHAPRPSVALDPTRPSFPGSSSSAKPPLLNTTSPHSPDRQTKPELPSSNWHQKRSRKRWRSHHELLILLLECVDGDDRRDDARVRRENRANTEKLRARVPSKVCSHTQKTRLQPRHRPYTQYYLLLT
ncbi:hypothetical protein M758_5G138400 [Ceratodon purpureus]|nr:hypothetical protein M758_5G138400 [Ceratodon purpureus]